MARLRNLKHEIVAQNYAKQLSDPGVKNPSQASAYQSVFVESKHNSARTNSNRVFHRPEVRTRVGELLAASGVTEEVLLARYNELSTANKEVLDANGNVRELRDNSTRLECLKLGLKMYRMIDDGTTIDNRSLTLNIEGVSSSGLDASIAAIVALSPQETIPNALDGDSETGAAGEGRGGGLNIVPPSASNA